MFLLLTAAASSGTYADTGPITTLHLIVIAVLIVLVALALLWGVRQKRARNAADAQQEATAETLLAHPQDTTAVAPAPPPPSDAGVTAAQSEPAAPAPEPPAVQQPAKVSRQPAVAAYRLIDVKGLGPKAVPLLDAQGVSDVAGLAALTPERAAQIDASLGALSGRMTRDRWVEQAKLLAAGDVAGFEATYGKL